MEGFGNFKMEQSTAKENGIFQAALGELGLPPMSVQTCCLRTILVIALIPIVLYSGLAAYNYAIADFGKFTDFQSIGAKGEVSIPDTDWAIRVDKSWASQTILVNKTTRREVEVLLSVGDAAFTTFMYQNRQYIIVRGYGGGTDGAYNYAVLDISGSTPVVIGHEHVCGNPKLNGDSLEFDDFSSKCDFFPFGGNIRVRVMKLN